MPKKINYKLSEQSRKELDQAIRKEPDLRLRQRVRIILLLDEGYKHPQVARLLSIKVSQVYWWHKRWREEGLSGLSDRPRSGRPLSGGEAYEKKLEQLLESAPKAYGYASTVWDSKQLMAHLEKETGVKVCERTFRNILARLDYVYRRPKHHLRPHQDKAAKARAEETIEMLKKKPRPAKSTYSLWTKQP